MNITQNLLTLKHDDLSCENVTTFENIYYSTYLTNKCISIVQTVIDTYTVHASIAKKALETLLPIIDMVSKLDSLSVLSPCRLNFVKRMKNISAFIYREWNEIIYREVYFAYLIQQKDWKLSLIASNTNRQQVTNSDSAIKPFTYTDVDILQYEDLVLDSFIRNIHDINSLRSVSHELYAQYNSETVTNIAIKNLKDILQKLFNLESDAFIDTMISCGAIVAGSVTAQCFTSGVDGFDKFSDVDIYVPVESDSDSLISFIIAAGYTLSSSVPLITLTLSSHYVSNTSYRFNPNIERISTYKGISGRSIQVIFINNAEQMSTFEFGEFVISTYDLSFLKNFFDGVILYAYDFNGVVTKSGSVTPYTLEKCSVEASVLNIRNWYCALTVTIIRCLKYQQRIMTGYTIKNYDIIFQLNFKCIY